jgi:Family of unknown function (DUF6188)
MSRDHFEERADSWRLRIEGWKVSRCSTDPEHEIDVVSPSGGSESDRFEIAGGELVGAQGKDLVGSAVREAVVWKDGRLSVSFSDGSLLKAAPDPEVEAWQIVGPDGLLVVAPIGEDEPHIWFGGGDDPRFELSLRG